MVLRPHGHRRFGLRHLAQLSVRPQRRRGSAGEAPRRAPFQEDLFRLPALGLLVSLRRRPRSAAHARLRLCISRRSPALSLAPLSVWRGPSDACSASASSPGSSQRYGGHIFHWLRGYYRPALWTLAAIGIIAGAVALWFYLRERRRHTTETSDQPQRVPNSASHQPSFG